MTKYKVISSTNQAFVGVELPFDFSDNKVGDQITFLNGSYKVTQVGQIINLSNEDSAITLIEI